MKKKIYLDYAATTPVIPEVANYMHQILLEEFGNPSSIHHHGRKAKTVVEQARKVIADYIHASVGEVFFTSGATESTHTIFYSCLKEFGIERIISSVAEHHCVTHTLAKIVAEQEIEVIMLPTDKHGRVSLEVMENELKVSDKKTLLSLMHGNNEIGTLHDLEKIGEVSSKYNCFFMVDAAQTFGKYPIDVGAMNISFMTASAHKLFGPKGTGLLYVNSNNIIAPLFLGGSQERNMRAGTENVHGIAGFGKATELALLELDERKSKLKNIKSYAMEKLKKMDGVEFNGDISEEGSMHHVLSVSFPKSKKSEHLAFNLDIAGICASTGSACSSGVEHDSDVLQAIGHDPTRKTVRFSFSHFTNKEEIDFLIETLRKIS